MRSGHASHYGALCPICHKPLVEHFVRGSMRPSARRTYVISGTTRIPCFEVGVE